MPLLELELAAAGPPPDDMAGAAPVMRREDGMVM
jgi:hypothetical protein